MAGTTFIASSLALLAAIVLGLAAPASATTTRSSTASLSVLTDELEAGVYQRADVYGFVAGDTVNFYLDASSVSLGSSPIIAFPAGSGYGYGGLEFLVPKVAPGMHRITARDTSRHDHATGEFQVIAPPKGTVFVAVGIQFVCDEFHPSLGYNDGYLKIDIHGLVPNTFYTVGVGPIFWLAESDDNGNLIGSSFPQAAALTRSASARSSATTTTPGCISPGKAEFTITSNYLDDPPNAVFWSKPVTIKVIGAADTGPSAITATPSPIAAGKRVNITGHVAYKGPRVGVRLGSAALTLNPGNISLGQTTTGVLGGINTTATIPATIPAGSYTLTATGSDSASTQLVIGP